MGITGFLKLRTVSPQCSTYPPQRIQHMNNSYAVNPCVRSLPIACAVAGLVEILAMILSLCSRYALRAQRHRIDFSPIAISGA